MVSPPQAPSVATQVDQVMAFLIANGYPDAAAALREDADARFSADAEPPPLPMLRVTSSGGLGGGGTDGYGSSGATSDAFVSMRSSPSGLLNPYGLWSSPHAKSEASSSDMEFGTARDYQNNGEFFNENWWYDEHLGSRRRNPSQGEDKFVVPTDARRHGNGHFDNIECEGCSEVYKCSLPICDCCGRPNRAVGDLQDKEKMGDSNSTVYGRYQIMDDLTEVLDEYRDNVYLLKRSGEQGEDVVLEGDLLNDIRKEDEEELELGIVEKELQMLGSSTSKTNFVANNGLTNDLKSKEELQFNVVDEEEGILGGYIIQPFPKRSDGDDAFELYDDETAEDFQESGNLKAEEPENPVELALSKFYDEFEVFDLRIIHRKNRTGFEESKDFPIILNSVVAGRYYVTEYLGSAAFSKVIQAHDVHTGMDVCLKIIKNDKDFLDQSLDEIKLLKFVNKYDPADEHHILRLYDYFYHQEHLFIVTELLRANLYEFQKYNQESGGEVYFTLPRIQAIARQCLEALVYLHHLSIIHCDLKPENILIKSYSRCEIKVIDLGSSCFLSDNLSFYVQSRSYRAPEVILGLPYDQKIDIWSLGCILAELYTGDVLFPNETVSMMLARIIGIIGPIDMEMLALGREAHKYFSDTYDLYQKNEETNQVEYLIPEKSSLEKHLQSSDSKFVDFISYLLQVNPRRRPTASEALQHRWLSFAYQS